ncbi:MAG: Ig-like domain-containing protein, partial [Lachnospiraceae bacterium]|nr:Ig-like domain-containing protein [Lachnospiraceae bacterium]
DYEEDEDVDYEEEDYEDEEYEDVDYEEEDYEDEEYEDVEYEEEDYEEDEDVDYEEEDYEDEEDEDVDYEDEDYEDEEDEDEEYEDEYRGNVFGRIIHIITNLTPLDYVVVVFGCFVLVAAIVVANVYLSARATNKQVEAFAEIGTDIEDIGIIGESGLIAVANAESARLSQMMEMEGESEEQTGQESEETIQTNVIEVGINVTSIKSDIKIKFVNKKTNKLIGSVPFEVHVVGSNKTYDLKDDDKDGIIYQTGIDAGTYTVNAVALQEDSYSKYSLPTQGVSVKVVDTIEYKKVDVEDEIKTEAEINVAVEDTAQQNTEIESVLTDTVEWVESTKTELNPDSNYQEVNVSDIPDPATIARVAGFMKFSQNETVSGNTTGNNGDNTGEENTGNKYTALTINGDSSIQVGATGKVTGTTTPSGGAITWTSSNSSIVTVDSEGNLKGIAAGTATITGTCGDAKNTFNVTVTAVVTESYTEIKIEGDSSIQVGATGKVTGTTSPTAGGTITWTSSDDTVVKIDSNGNLTGVKVGTATIMGTCGGTKATFNVTVTDIEYTALKIEGDSTIQVGKTGKVTGTTTPSGGTITWTSSNTGVVTVDADGKLTGVTAGEATIKGTCGKNVSAEWKVKVVKDASGDTTSKLKDKNGTQIYIKTAEGKYVEAVYADYYTNAKFYLKKADAIYSYTGWQTIDGYTYFFDKNGNYVTGEQVIQGAKYSFDSLGRLASGSGVLGIDVSKWNGNIDWNAVRNSGISYAIIRCGYRGSTTGALIEDPKFRANIQGAQNAGIKVGVYFFTQAVNDVEAVEEASMVLSLIKGYNLSLPVFLDVEATSGNSGRADGISADSRTAVCSAFCRTIQNSGYKAGIYANKTWFNSFINTPSLTSYKIWLAQYAAAPTYTRTRIDMWQYSSKGTVSGINGNVDMNISYMN